MVSIRIMVGLLGVAAVLQSVGQELQWFSSYGSATQNAETGDLMITPSSNGGFFGVGMAGGNTWDLNGHTVTVSGDSDILLFQLNAEGEAQWARVAGGSCEDPDPWDDRPRCMLRDSASGNLLLAGDYSGNANFGVFQLPGWCEYRNLFVASYDENGTALWANRAAGPDVLADAMLIGPDENLHVFGIVNEAPATFYSSPNVVLQSGGFHASYTSGGAMVNAEHLLNTGEVYDGIRYGSDLVVCGRFVGPDTLWGAPLAPNAPLESGFLCKTNGLSAVDWTVVCGSSSRASFVDCVELANGDIAVAGYFVGDVYIGEDTLHTSPTPPGDRFLARFTPSGSLRWLKLVASPESFSIRSLVAASDGGFYLHGTVVDSLAIGTTTHPCTTGRDQYVARVDSLGNWIGALFLGRRSLSTMIGLCVSDDELVVAGGFDSTMVIDGQSFGPGHMLWPDLFVAKFDGLGPQSGIRSIGLDSDPLHIYANPNNGICTMDLPTEIRSGSPLQLIIYDSTGRIVEQLPVSASASGTIRMDIQAQAKGVYHVELLDDGRRYSGRIVFE